MKIVALDTETFPIGPGAIAPPMVCFTVAIKAEDGSVVTDLVGNGDPDCESQLAEYLALGHLLVLHSAVYDLSVIGESYPRLKPLIWAKLIEGEITCTKIREALLNLSTHGNIEKLWLPDGSSKPILYSLADLVSKYLGVDISATKGPDTWRMQFGLLDGKKASEYPREAASYAQDDAGYTLQVYDAQETCVESEDGRGSLGTQFFRTAVDYALNQLTIHGMPIDKARVLEMQAMLEIELADDKLALLVQHEIMRPGEPARPYANGAKNPDGTPKMVAATATSICRENLTTRVEAIARANGVALRHTEKGGVSADAEMIAELSPFDPVLAQYEHRAKLQKLVTTEIPRLYWEGQIVERIHFKFKPLVKTGRTSSGADGRSPLYPSASGQQMDPRIRPSYVASPGQVLYSVDYQTLELCTVAQTTFELCGQSEHRNRINAGFDLHALLASQLVARLGGENPLANEVRLGAAVGVDEGYKAFLALKKTDPAFYKHWRTLAKPTGLGLPGGLGARTFVAFAKANYDVDLVQLSNSMLEFEPKVNRTVLYYAHQLYGWDKVHERGEHAWTPMLRAIALAQEMKEVWHALYPEMTAYFDWVQKNMRDDHNPEMGVRDDGKPIQGYCYTSPMGMHRAACLFTDVANGFAMQTPSAEGATGAVIRLVRACHDVTQNSILYGTRPCNFIHDEIMGEIPEDNQMHERCLEIQRIMEESMQLICPDVKIKAAPCLMRRWDKAAEPVFDAAGRLTVWEPPTPQKDIARAVA